MDDATAVLLLRAADEIEALDRIGSCPEPVLC
jgi:hypothetical protein